jgi:hypothetical protein
MQVKGVEGKGRGVTVGVLAGCGAGVEAAAAAGGGGVRARLEVRGDHAEASLRGGVHCCWGSLLQCSAVLW